MSKNNFLRTALISFSVLLIPLLGNIFVGGWNWTWHDFLFAWVFFVVMGTTIRWAMGLAPHTYRVVIGVAVFLLFAAFWVLLATG